MHWLASACTWTPAFIVPPPAPPRPHLQQRQYAPRPLPPPTPKSNPAPMSTRAPPPSCSIKIRYTASDARTVPSSLYEPSAESARATLPPGFSHPQQQRRHDSAAGAPPKAPDREWWTPLRTVAAFSERDHRGTRALVLLATQPLHLTAAARRHRHRPCPLCVPQLPLQRICCVGYRFCTKICRPG